MVLVWFLLGMVIDSIPIMLPTVPVFEPLATAFGYDRIAFAVVRILAMAAGLLAYTMKAAIQDDEIKVDMTMIVIFPGIANFLPDLLF